MNKKASFNWVAVITFVIGILSTLVFTLPVINDLQNKNEILNQSLMEKPLEIEKIVYIYDNKTIDNLKQDNEMLLNELWEMVKNPIVVTIIEEHSHSSRTNSNTYENITPKCGISECVGGRLVYLDDGRCVCKPIDRRIEDKINFKPIFEIEKEI